MFHIVCLCLVYPGCVLLILTFRCQNPTSVFKKGKGSPYSITERMVPLLSACPAFTPAILKRAATNFAAW